MVSGCYRLASKGPDFAPHQRPRLIPSSATSEGPSQLPSAHDGAMAVNSVDTREELPVRLNEHLGVGQTISLSPLVRTIFSPVPLSPLPWEEPPIRTRPVRTLGVDQTISLAEILARNRERETIHREEIVNRRKLLMSVQAILPTLKAGGSEVGLGKVMEHPLEEGKSIRSVWTEEEKEIFTQMYLKNPKDFVKIAENLEKKSVKDCVLMYYLTKKNL